VELFFQFKVDPPVDAAHEEDSSSEKEDDAPQDR